MTGEQMTEFLWGPELFSHKSSWIHGTNVYASRRAENIGECNPDTITTKWFEWFWNKRKNTRETISPPISVGNGKNVIFVAPEPFRTPYDHDRIVINTKTSILVRLYCMTASESEYPSLLGKKAEETEKNILNLIKKDLLGIRWEAMEASFDGEKIQGHCVITKKPSPIKVVPGKMVGYLPTSKMNTTWKVYHGGFWLLLKEEILTSGDHLLYFKASSRCYESEGKILINVCL
jgi:hypothetical protein